MGTVQNQLFSGANALIFGAAKGIGRAVALEWAKRGANVAVADIDMKAATETAAEIEKMGGKAVPLDADVTSDASVQDTAKAAEAALGDIDILMNNVGATLNGYPEDIPFSEWRRITELNYFGTLRALEIFLPKMLSRNTGHIVNTASFAGLYPYASSRLPYAAAKAAIISLSEGLALHLEPKGVSVSCLIPGPVMTDILSSMSSWSSDCVLVGPGANLCLVTPEDVAVTLTEGMAAGQILIPSHPQAWDTITEWAQSPDAFIRRKIMDFERGEFGRPSKGSVA